MVNKGRRSRRDRRAIKETLEIDKEFRDKTGMGVLEVLKQEKCRVLQEFIQLMANL